MRSLTLLEYTRSFVNCSDSRVTESAWCYKVTRLSEQNVYETTSNTPLELTSCELLTGFLDRLKRTASDTADRGSELNPFRRLRQSHRRKALTLPVARQAARDGVPPEAIKESLGTNSQTDNDIGDLEEGQVSEHHSKKELSGNRTVWEQIRTALFNRWINLLLVCAPAGVITHYLGVNG